MGQENVIGHGLSYLALASHEHDERFSKHEDRLSANFTQVAVS